MRTRLALLPLLALCVSACGGDRTRGLAPLKPLEENLPDQIGVKERSFMEWKGQFCAVNEPSHRLIMDQNQWSALWRELGQETPAADLAENFGAAVFLGTCSTGGYSVKVLDPALEDGRLVVRYKVSPPRGLSIQALTQPYAVRLFPRSPLEVRMEAATP